MTLSMNWIKIAALSLAVYVALVSLFYSGSQLTSVIERTRPPMKKQSSKLKETSNLNNIQAIRRINNENATSANFIKSKTSDQIKDDKVVEESRLKAALEKATERFEIFVSHKDFWSKNNRTFINASNCGNCQVTFDENRIAAPSTKAVIIHFNLVKRHAMTKERRTDQYYIWLTLESPVALGTLRGLTLKEFDDVFNLTMTYRRDSDVYFPYGMAERILQNIHTEGSGNPQHDLDTLIKSKRKMALWIVGNCGITPGARVRMKYSEQLVKAGLDLDRRGGCFPNAPRAPNRRVTFTQAWGDFLRPYKFYMAFENAFSCNDYITEKFFRNSLTHGLVPVVLGAKKSDYEAVSPKHSFIYANDFENAEKLVEYLRYLDGNDTAYREYLAWRTHDPEEMPYRGRAVGLCQLCRILHGINIDNKYDENFKEKYSEIPLYGQPKKPRNVHSLRNWFYGNEDKKCISNY